MLEMYMQAFNLSTVANLHFSVDKSKLLPNLGRLLDVDTYIMDSFLCPDSNLSLIKITW